MLRVSCLGFAMLITVCGQQESPATVYRRVIDSARVGEVTLVRPAMFAYTLLAVSKSEHNALVKILKAADEYGLKQLVRSGGVRFLSSDTQVLVLEQDPTVASESIRIVNESWYRKSRIKIACDQLYGSKKAQEKNCIAPDYTYITRQFLGTTNVEDFVKRNVLVCVRVLSGPEKGQAGWTYLSEISLPTVMRRAE